MAVTGYEDVHISRSGDIVHVEGGRTEEECAIDDLAATVLLHVRTAAVAVDGHGRVGVFNPAAARVLDVPVEQVLGRELSELTGAGPALAALAGVIAEARRTGVAEARRQVVVDTPLGVRTLGYTASVLADGGTALFFTDLTDALAVERRAAEAQRFAEVGRIAGAMAHELKTPLATVELYVNLMRRALADDSSAVHQLDVIKDQTRLCLDRIGAIMHSINPDAARAGGMTLTAIPPVVRHVVDVLRGRHEGARLVLRVAGDGEPRAALAVNDLRSVVTNLITNALQVTGGKGPVSVRVSHDADTVTLTIADRGPGLPDGDVFEAFYTTRSSGTGLGLWLVRRVVEDAGGTITAGGRRGGGTVFTVRMPLPRHARLQDATILVLEDDARLRAATVAALEACGAVVTAAPSGKDVPLEDEQWRCAVLDYHLPDMNGIEVAARLASATPFLLVSGDPAAGAALADVRGRRAWYLPKPFEVDVYLDLVSLLVGAT